MGQRWAVGSRDLNLHISNWICQKVAEEIVKPSQFCCRHKVKKKLPSPPLCFGQTTANHHHTPHCGLTLIGDQKQTSYTVKSHLTTPQTLTAVKVSKQQPPSPVLLTHNSELELSLGCLAKQALTASPLNFEQPQWLEHWLCPCSSESYSSYLLANSLIYIEDITRW